MNATLPTTPVSLGRVFLNGFQLWVASFTHVLPLLLLFFLWLLIPWLGSPTGFIGITTDLSAYSPVWAGIYVAAYFIGVLILYIAVYQRIYDMVFSRESGFVKALGSGVKKMPIFILAAIISIITVVIGLALLVIPGAYLGLVMPLFYPLIIVEDIRNPFKGLKHFCQLIWGNWWRSIVVVFAPVFVIWLFNFGAQCAMGYLEMHHGLLADRGWMIENGFQAFFNAFFLPITAGIVITYLFDLKLRYQRKLAAEANIPKVII